MSRVSFVGKSSRRDSYNTVDNSDFMRACATLTESTSELTLEVILDAIHIPVQVIVGPKSFKIISMYNDCDITDCVIENTRVGGSGSETGAFHRLCVGVLPQFSSVAGPTDTSHLSGREIGLSPISLGSFI